MRYVSTRGNHEPVSSARAIDLGMVPQGGLFVPESVPMIAAGAPAGVTYRQTARQVLRPLLADFADTDLERCIDSAYDGDAFDAPAVIDLKPLGRRRYAMELWHGPTAAFKDVALQIMPHLMDTAKRMLGATSHTLILVATSGDTGKAALEGFKDCPGISILVFYPAEGVSEIQRLQMTTTDGANTFVAAVRGNFDDCQTGVKQLFGDETLAERLLDRGVVLSSANSINWGRLCPQIVYYFHAYRMLVERGELAAGEPVTFCVPTGNFGNILAAYYAWRMGLPVKRLICASNKNRVLADFFSSGVYDRNRDFYKTMSPSMDILISSNLERFLYEVTGHDAARVNAWYESLSRSGRFNVDAPTLAAMRHIICAGWVDEPAVLAAIGRVWRADGYVLDTHTAVGVAVAEDLDPGDAPTIIDATASPYKFSGSVLTGMTGARESDEFRSIERIHELSGMPVHRALAGLRERPVRHGRVIGPEDMGRVMDDILAGAPGGAPR
jgi:threonine synthase